MTKVAIIVVGVDCVKYNNGVYSNYYCSGVDCVIVTKVADCAIVTKVAIIVVAVDCVKYNNSDQ